MKISPAHGRSLKDQLRGLWNRHEIPGDLGVGDGHRTQTLDLLLEEMDDTALASDHISKPDRHKTGGIRGMTRSDHLCHSFRGPHHIGGPNRLVRGDHDESLHSKMAGRLDDVSGSDNVIIDRFPGI
jgi:hypothetical protein